MSVATDVCPQAERVGSHWTSQAGFGGQNRERGCSLALGSFYVLR